jgi:uncharacterized integral membrane protein
MEFFVWKSQADLVVIFAEMITGILIAIFSSFLYASLRNEAAKAEDAAQGA